MIGLLVHLEVERKKKAFLLLKRDDAEALQDFLGGLEEEASSKIRQECSLKKGMAGTERNGGMMFAHNYVSNLDRPFLPSVLPSFPLSLPFQSVAFEGARG